MIDIENADQSGSLAIERDPAHPGYVKVTSLEGAEEECDVFKLGSFHAASLIAAIAGSTNAPAISGEPISVKHKRRSLLERLLGHTDRQRVEKYAFQANGGNA
ncbi:hypothetical protein [Microbacterium sp. zg-YB36]|uniref:hypothetical protein n=1 Tax=Microbacterium sp. zg-YB36 TaxID=2969407 RepID=UPI00214ACF72|nr:hypothetical protein [Microbacterium sp. zg-YB36]MDL5351193.1 hypothetical protein [Microbacterium sp. zg-YB36]